MYSHFTDSNLKCLFFHSFSLFFFPPLFNHLLVIPHVLIIFPLFFFLSSFSFVNVIFLSPPPTPPTPPYKLFSFSFQMNESQYQLSPFILFLELPWLVHHTAFFLFFTVHNNIIFICTVLFVRRASKYFSWTFMIVCYSQFFFKPHPHPHHVNPASLVRINLLLGVQNGEVKQGFGGGLFVF